jgi:hypothetical protein
MSRLSGLALLACAALLVSSCGSAKPQVKLNRWGQPLKDGVPPPNWVDKIPESTKEKHVAVGFCGPTFWPQDAMNNAAEDARGKLALSLSSKVERVQQNVEQTDYNRSLDITKEATDLVMQNSRIVATWVDEAGARGEPGSVWALAVIDNSGSHDHADRAVTPAGGKGAPGWLDRLPSSPARLYAAGYSGPTFRASDALQYAGDAAVVNLASSLRSHVQAYNLVIATGTGQSIDDFARLADPEAEFLELVRKKAKIEQVWVDDDGSRAGDPPGSVWALASIEVGSTKGVYESQQNSDTGPALDNRGNAK